MNLDDNPVDAYHRGLKNGAEGERKRIRRAQREALRVLRVSATAFNRPTLMNLAVTFDAATRAKKGKAR